MYLINAEMTKPCILKSEVKCSREHKNINCCQYKINKSCTLQGSVKKTSFQTDMQNFVFSKSDFPVTKKFKKKKKEFHQILNYKVPFHLSNVMMI